MKLFIYKALLITGLLFLFHQLAAQKKLIATYEETYTNPGWAPFDSVIYTYDGNNKEYLQIRKLYDASAKSWTYFTKFETAYNTKGEVDSTLSYKYSGGIWIFTQSEHYSYDANGKPVSKLTKKFAGGNWQDTLVENTVYRTDGKVDSAFLFTINSMGNNDAYSRDIYAYATDGTLASITTQRLKSGNWENSERFIFTYDGSKHLANRNVENYFGTWFKIDNVTYTYDATNPDLLREELDKITDNGTPISKRKYIYEGDPTNTSVFTLKENTVFISVYPNPMTETTTIQWQNAPTGSYTLELADISGRVVKRIENINTGQTLIQKDNLCEGIYYYRLAGPGGIATGKLLVK